MATRIRIIGVGSPFGDDRLGWTMVEMLRASRVFQSAAGKIDFTVLDRPGFTLLNHMGIADVIILIDAVRSGAKPGTLHLVAADNIESGTAVASSHGFGIAEALALARALGELPDSIILCGVEIDMVEASEDLSPAVQKALPVLKERIERMVVDINEGTAATVTQDVFPA